MFRSLSMTRSDVAPAGASVHSLIVWPVRSGAKSIVSPLRASLIRSRSVPSPKPSLLVTVSVLGRERSSRVSSDGRNRGGAGLGLARFPEVRLDSLLRNQDENNTV